MSTFLNPTFFPSKNKKGEEWFIKSIQGRICLYSEKEEIQERIVYYTTSTSWVINGNCRILYRNRPLEGATVTFEPESFLGPSFQECSGVTNERGEAFITRDNSEIAGIYLGFYRVRVTKEKANGKELLPAKYINGVEQGSWQPIVVYPWA